MTTFQKAKLIRDESKKKIPVSLMTLSLILHAKKFQLFHLQTN